MTYKAPVLSAAVGSEAVTVEVRVIDPATLPVTAPTNPLVEVTGPEKVVEAMCNYLLHKVSLVSLCNVRGNVLSNKLLWIPMTKYTYKKEGRIAPFNGVMSNEGILDCFI